LSHPRDSRISSCSRIRINGLLRVSRGMTKTPASSTHSLTMGAKALRAFFQQPRSIRCLQLDFDQFLLGRTVIFEFVSF